MVKYTGDIILDLHGEVVLKVNMIVSNYPYDIQNVTMILSCWSNTIDEVLIYPYGENPI